MITILLVENDPVVRTTTGEILELMGYRVIMAEDGLTGLHLFQQYQSEIALVVSDMAMPEMGGEDLFLALQAINPQVKVILMSGFLLEDRGESLLSKGLIACIKKPFPIPNLLEEIEQALAVEVV